MLPSQSPDTRRAESFELSHLAWRPAALDRGLHLDIQKQRLGRELSASKGSCSQLFFQVPGDGCHLLEKEEVGAQQGAS